MKPKTEAINKINKPTKLGIVISEINLIPTDLISKIPSNESYQWLLNEVGKKC